MADKYSVVYDPANRQPFAIIRDSSNVLTAHPVQRSAQHWASGYNGGNKTIPYGMTATDFVEMNCDFVKSFSSYFGRNNRVKRRAEMLSGESSHVIGRDIIYGVGPRDYARRSSRMSRKVMPIISHLQREMFRSRLIQESIRTGKRWLRKNEA
jgi:hypothetical protein